MWVFLCVFTYSSQPTDAYRFLSNRATTCPNFFLALLSVVRSQRLGLKFTAAEKALLSLLLDAAGDIWRVQFGRNPALQWLLATSNSADRLASVAQY